jgi:hypothetical protein
MLHISSCLAGFHLPWSSSPLHTALHALLYTPAQLHVTTSCHDSSTLIHHEKLAYLSLCFGGQENVVVQTEDQCGLACFLNNGYVDSPDATMYLLLMP